MKAEFLARIRAARAARRQVALITRLSDGCQLLLDGDDRLGELELDRTERDALQRQWASGDSGVLDNAETLFARIYAPPPRLLIVGAVHIAQALAPMATMVGYAVTIIDPRRAFASVRRFPEVDLSGEWPDEAIAQLVPDARTAIVTLSHDPKLDDPALAVAVLSPAFYIGALGSTRTHEKRLGRLRERGLGAELGRIHAPIGLDLGGRRPSEIAVSILAEIIRVRHKEIAP